MTFRPRPLLAVFGLGPDAARRRRVSLRAAVRCTASNSPTYDTVLRAAPLDTAGRAGRHRRRRRKSLASIGQWPWRRDLVGRLVSRLRDAGAAAVALDIIFAEARPVRGTRSCRRMRPSPRRSGPDVCARLRHDVRASGYGCRRMRPAPAGARGASADEDDGASAPFFERDRRHLQPADARRSGRRVGLPERGAGSGWPAASRAAADRAGRTHLSVARTGGGDRDERTRGTSRCMSPMPMRPHCSSRPDHPTRQRVDACPLDGRSNLLLRYRGRKRTFHYVSAVDVLTNRSAPDAFADKLVLVGTTALGTREVVSTPHDTLFTGVEVQATIADNLLQRDFISARRTRRTRSRWPCWCSGSCSRRCSSRASA